MLQLDEKNLIWFWVYIFVKCRFTSFVSLPVNDAILHLPILEKWHKKVILSMVCIISQNPNISYINRYIHKVMPKYIHVYSKPLLCFLWCNFSLYCWHFFFQEIHSKYLTPLQPIAREPQPYVSKQTVSQSLSPYYLSNEDPQKNFMSGNYIRINQSIDTYSKTCLVRNLYNPFPCVDRHWCSFPFDH